MALTHVYHYLYYDVVFIKVLFPKIDSSVETVVGNESPTDDILQLSDARQAARDAIGRGDKKKRSRLNPPQFKVGDKVWRLNVRSQQRKGGKLERDFSGPFTIVKLQDKSADLQSEEGRLFPKISTDHLKKYVEQNPQVPHKFTTTPATASAPPATAASTAPPASSAPPWQNFIQL